MAVMMDVDDKKVYKDVEANIKFMKQKLIMNKNFDIIYRVVYVADRQCVIYCIDGFTKDDTLQKIIQFLFSVKAEDMPDNAHEFSKNFLPYGEISTEDEFKNILTQLLSGITFMFVDGYDKAISIDCRSYPMRSVSEPDKDKVLRGSRDGFVETIVFNTALIRRRIRDPQLVMETMQVGISSSTDVVLSYINSRVDQRLLANIRKKITNLKVDALTMNQESLAECIYPYKWYNPFPKFKFTERPDTAAAGILEGNIVILVDNSPSAMILPSSVFDIIEEADDYYFPPITGTYLRLSRMIISFLTLVITPIWLLFMQNTRFIPPWLQFIMIKDTVNVPIILQLLILEIAIDGLRLAAINTPSMLTTPLSVTAGIVMGEFAVKSGWFNSETMLYMAFVSIANYTQSSFELGYALKFMRIITLILTSLFNVWGFVIGQIISIAAVVSNKTISGKSYIYPIIPLSLHELKRRLFRMRISYNEVYERKN